ncbi:MAG: response regulator, partial [Atribacterota bacterium]
MTIPIALVDDHPIFSAGLKRLLEDDGQYEVVCIASSMKEALDTIPFSKVAIVLVDVNMPGGDGIELLKGIKQKYAETR